MTSWPACWATRSHPPLPIALPPLSPPPCRHTPEEAQVDFLAGLLGYKKVGWIFSQSKSERDFIMHTGELLQVRGGEEG